MTPEAATVGPRQASAHPRLPSGAESWVEERAERRPEEGKVERALLPVLMRTEAEAVTQAIGRHVRSD